MQAESWNDERQVARVGAGEHRHPGTVQLTDEVQPAIEQGASLGGLLGCAPGLDDVLQGPAPAIGHRHRHVPESLVGRHHVVRPVEHPVHGEGGDHSGAVAGQGGEHRCRLPWAVAGHRVPLQPVDLAQPGDEVTPADLQRGDTCAQLLFAGGGVVPGRVQVLDAELPRCARAAQRDGVRTVSGERYPLPAGLIRDRAMEIARKPRVHLDEVGALLLGVAYRLPRLSFGGDFYEQRGISDGGSAVDDAAGDDRPRAEQLAALDLGAPAV